MNPYSDNSYFNYYTPQRSVAVNSKGINGNDYVAHPSEQPIKETKHIFAIDSRQRDLTLNPSASEYSISVPEYYKNIKSIELKAAIVPKTEYNVHTNNNTIPFSIGDFVYSVSIDTSQKSNKFPRTTATSDVANGQTVTFTVTGGNTADPAILSATTLNGGIGPITVVYGGSGYTPEDILNITATIAVPGYGSLTKIFNYEFGIRYNAELREGQYSNTGNPEYYHVNTSSGTSSGVRTIMRSNVPVNGLSREIENAMGNAIYSRNTNNTSLTYRRIGWYELTYDTTVINYQVGGTSESLYDYPAPISVRYVNQYPILDRFGVYSITTEQTPDYYETNACNFNRMNFCNNLVIRAETTAALNGDIGDFVVIDNFAYQVIDYHNIGTNDGGTTYDYLLMLLPYGNKSGTVTAGWEIQDPTAGLVWDGITASTAIADTATGGLTDFFATGTGTVQYVSPWHLLFQEPDADIAALIGFNRTNYLTGTLTEPITIETNAKKNYLQGAGYTHRTDNDWTLYAGPEYVILSFRSKLNNTSNTLNSEMNDRIDSDQVSNISRSFACLIFDNNQPAVLQGLTTSRAPDYDLSGKQTTEVTNRYSQILNLGDDYDTNLGTAVKQNGRILDSYVGSYNSGLYTYPGLTKALKGQDFDIKKIEFNQPVSRLANISIQFTKFSKINNQTDDELYDFRGREHLLLFEIVTCEHSNVY